MKEIKILFVLLILFSTSVFAEPVENYNDVQYLEMDLKISSDLDINYAGSNSDVEFFKGDLSFFPKNDLRQIVQNLDTFSSPNANIQQSSEEIKYTWTGNLGNKITYGYDSNVKIFNSFSKVDKKIKFPITNIDSSVLEFTQASEFIDLNSKIENRANSIIGTEDDYYEVVFKLAEWTNNNIDYNLTSLTADAVKPSSWVLENKKGVCDEMTNLFISFLRSVGIPARFVSGMVYSNIDYSWGAHGWAEVYFPDIGWVPFDVTFGEYGWLDPSHIKLKHDIDSGSPTAKYSWKASEINIDIGELEIDTFSTKVGSKEVGVVDIELIPVKSSAKFESYVPFEVKIKNLKDIYIAPKIIITKAPSLTEKNVKRILLKPKEEKSIYWILEIPEGDSEYTYTSTIEAKGIFGEIGTSTLKYGDNFEYYSKEYAESIVNSHREREKKEKLKEILIACESDKKTYYGGENAEINCILKNKANSRISFDLCFLDKCKKIIIEKNEELNEKEFFFVEKSIRIPVVVENEGKIAYNYVNLNVIPIAEISVSNPEPSEVNYDDDVEISFDIISNTDVKNLIVKFDFGEMEYEEFKEKEVRTINVNTQGKQLLDDIIFTLSYEDELGKEYEEKKALHVKVNNVPWYGGFLNWLVNLF